MLNQSHAGTRGLLDSPLCQQKLWYQPSVSAKVLVPALLYQQSSGTSQDFADTRSLLVPEGLVPEGLAPEGLVPDTRTLLTPGAGWHQDFAETRIKKGPSL
jgi:hypothetical protein